MTSYRRVLLHFVCYFYGGYGRMDNIFITLTFGQYILRRKSVDMLDLILYTLYSPCSLEQLVYTTFN